MAKKNQDSILHLVLKGKWWDMTESGEKGAEYREINLYWLSRFMNIGRTDLTLGDYPRIINALREGSVEQVVSTILEYKLSYKYFDALCLHRGYTSNTLTLKSNGLRIGRGKPEHGAPEDRNVFIFEHGERL